jgi:hypothetical protein
VPAFGQVVFDLIDGPLDAPELSGEVVVLMALGFAYDGSRYAQFVYHEFRSPESLR